MLKPKVIVNSLLTISLLLSSPDVRPAHSADTTFSTEQNAYAAENNSNEIVNMNNNSHIYSEEKILFMRELCVLILFGMVFVLSYRCFIIVDNKNISKKIYYACIIMTAIFYIISRALSLVGFESVINIIYKYTTFEIKLFDIMSFDFVTLKIKFYHILYCIFVIVSCLVIHDAVKLIKRNLRGMKNA